MPKVVRQIGATRAEIEDIKARTDFYARELAARYPDKLKIRDVRDYLGVSDTTARKIMRGVTFCAGIKKFNRIDVARRFAERERGRVQ